MIWLNSTFALALIGWSIFAPFVFLFTGYYVRGLEDKENDAEQA